MDELQLAAMFDQINACHREAMESFLRFTCGFFQMTEEDRQSLIKGLMPFQRRFLLDMARAGGNDRLATALSGEDSE